MEKTQTVRCQAFVTAHVNRNDIVRCGPVGAVWQVATRKTIGDEAEFTLAPYDPHDVPFGLRVPGLPLPY